MTEQYDSRPDTLHHIERVQFYLSQVRDWLENRGRDHDASKLEPPEKEAFDRCTPILKTTIYGTPEYKDATRALGPALDHHYLHNRHHPEFHADGVVGMTLLDLIEMLADWKAAGERQADGGDMLRSLEINAQRHVMPESVKEILRNTIDELCWRPPPPLDTPDAGGT